MKRTGNYIDRLRENTRVYFMDEKTDYYEKIMSKTDYKGVMENKSENQTSFCLFVIMLPLMKSIIIEIFKCPTTPPA